ncbi:MAG: hypothetical protein FJ144_10085 [Deltaproteobacteria bacterium]|nr:hypothetical protein [Deltaproteobacteria bacterium]
MESGLEKELREWRENRVRAMSALAATRAQIFPMPSVTPSHKGGRRLRVNGQEVLVVAKARRISN